MNKKSLQIQQLDKKMTTFIPASEVTAPPTGWIKAVRLTLGMSLQQLANKLGITKQSAQEIEKREMDRTISLKSLIETAQALDMKLVYGFVPKDGSLELLIERRAHELATKIVKRTSHSMRLEDQLNSEARLKKAIEERAISLKLNMPKNLWD